MERVGEKRKASGRLLSILGVESQARIHGLARREVKGLCFGITDAEDLEQEAYLEACEKADHFQGRTEEELSVWIIGIVQNKARNHRRNEEAAKRVFGMPDQAPVSLDEVGARERPPDVLFEGSERDETVREAMKKVCSKVEGRLLDLVYIREVKISELADELHVHPDALKKRVERGAKKLYQYLRRLTDFQDLSRQRKKELPSGP